MNKRDRREAESAEKRLKKRKLTITINEAQWAYLHQLCAGPSGKGLTEPDVMASSVFCRGLCVIADEIGVDWNPATTEARSATEKYPPHKGEAEAMGGDPE